LLWLNLSDCKWYSSYFKFLLHICEYVLLIELKSFVLSYFFLYHLLVKVDEELPISFIEALFYCLLISKLEEGLSPLIEVGENGLIVFPS
jgi:hypothetical protein